MIFDAIRRWMGIEPADGSDSSNGSKGPERPPGGGGEASSDGISCRDALSKIYEFLDGELDDLTHEEVEEHFRVCERCYPHLQLEEAFRNALHRAVEERDGAPPHLKERVLQLMEETGDGGS